MKILAVQSGSLYGGHLRLNASYYGERATRAHELLESAGVPVASLGDPAVTSRVFNPPRFRRVYVADEDHGVPYLTGAKMLAGKPEKEAFISRALTENLEEYIVHEGWVLVTDSGTIGRCQFASADYEGFAITNNVIRIVGDGVPAGYIFTWVNSPPGRALITRDTYGSVIDHIEPHHVRNVPIPIVDEAIQRSIDERVRRAAALRVEANRLFDEAESDLLAALGTSRAEWVEQADDPG